MKITVQRSNSLTDSQNEVADLEIVIPKAYNNADFVNDVLIPKIQSTGFYAINNEIRWCKNKQGQDVLMYFGATEGRTTLKQVIKQLQTA